MAIAIRCDPCAKVFFMIAFISRIEQPGNWRQRSGSMPLSSLRSSHTSGIDF
jgi:hypothetical protein